MKTIEEIREAERRFFSGDTMYPPCPKCDGPNVKDDIAINTDQRRHYCADCKHSWQDWIYP